MNNTALATAACANMSCQERVDCYIRNWQHAVKATSVTKVGVMQQSNNQHEQVD